MAFLSKLPSELIFMVNHLPVRDVNASRKRAAQCATYCRPFCAAKLWTGARGTPISRR